MLIHHSTFFPLLPTPEGICVNESACYERVHSSYCDTERGRMLRTRDNIGMDTLHLHLWGGVLSQRGRAKHEHEGHRNNLLGHLSKAICAQ